jgi:DNA-binding CsgD family transcriptional regulator
LGVGRARRGGRANTEPPPRRRGVDRLVAATSATDSDWALGVAARSRALASEGDATDALYVEAIARLGRTPVRPDLARAHLLYGEWLRRENRRVDARAQLLAAHEMLNEIGMEAFAERIRIELLATGERVRKRVVESREELTSQEARIARLARDGLSNPEIGARLFLSARTVEWHLHKVFTKLGITSRKQLRAALPGDPGSGSTRAYRIPGAPVSPRPDDAPSLPRARRSVDDVPLACVFGIPIRLEELLVKRDRSLIDQSLHSVRARRPRTVMASVSAGTRWTSRRGSIAVSIQPGTTGT